MKKSISLLMAASLMFSANLPHAQAADGWTKNDEIASADVKIGVISDSHITDSNSTNWLREALEANKILSGNSLDGLALNGDIIYQTDGSKLIPERYDTLMSVLSEEGYGNETGKTPYVYAMGNHEFPQATTSAELNKASLETFAEKTKQPVNYAAKMGGYWFIAAAASNYQGVVTAETESWIEQQIDAAVAEDASKPVFLMLHHPVHKTTFNESKKSYSDEFRNYLLDKPQVINITAHYHVAAQLPQTLYQEKGGFSVVQSPLTGGGYMGEWQCSKTEDISDCHQSALITVTDNVVKFYKIDLTTKELIGDPWVFNIPEMVKGNSDAYLYSADKSENTNTPAFPQNSSIEVKAEGTGFTVEYPNNATVEPTGALQDDFIRAYKVEVVSDGGIVLLSQIYQTDFWKPEANRTQTYRRTISGLEGLGTVTVKVYPMSPFGVFGEPLSAECAMPEVQLPDGALRFEFEDYYPYKDVVADCPLSSGRKLVASVQGGIISAPKTVPRATDASFSFEIDLPLDDTYELEYTLGSSTSEYLSKVELYIDNVSIGKNDGSYVNDISFSKIYPWQHVPMCVYQKSGLELSAGKHTVYVKIDNPVASGQPNLFCMDYIQFTPPAVEKVSVNSAKRFEFEDYGTSFPEDHFKAAENGSGGKVLCSNWYDNAAIDNMTLEIPMRFAESGYYDMEYMIGCRGWGDSYLSTVKLYLDDKQIAMNDRSFIEDVKDLFTDVWQAQSAPMSRYITRGIYVDKGKHILKAVVEKTSVDKKFKYQMDYVEFRSVDNISADDGEAFVSFDKPLTGKVFVALYNDKQLVGLQMQDANNQQSFNIKVPCDSAFTEAKAFLWSNTVSATPLSDVKTLKIQ